MEHFELLVKNQLVIANEIVNSEVELEQLKKALQEEEQCGMRSQKALNHLTKQISEKKIQLMQMEKVFQQQIESIISYYEQHVKHDKDQQAMYMK